MNYEIIQDSDPINPHCLGDKIVSREDLEVIMNDQENIAEKEAKMSMNHIQNYRQSS